MAQTAKQWLGRKGDVFHVSEKDGGIVGSLIGLGYVKKEMKVSETGPVETGLYIKTGAGKEWTKNQTK